MLFNPLLNQGSIQVEGHTLYGVAPPNESEEVVAGRLRGNCQRARADEVLQFICFAFALGLVGLGFLQLKRGRVGGGGYVA
jgi:hypothetical protein